MTWNATISLRAPNSRTPVAVPHRVAATARDAPGRPARPCRRRRWPRPPVTSAAAVPHPIAQSTTARTIRVSRRLLAHGQAQASLRSAPVAPALQALQHSRDVRPRHLRASRARWCDRPRSGSRNTARNCSIASCSRPSARSTGPWRAVTRPDEPAPLSTSAAARRSADWSAARHAAGSTGPITVAAS